MDFNKVSGQMILHNFEGFHIALWAKNPKLNFGILTSSNSQGITKGLLLVVSKQWFEFCPESKFPYPLLTSI